MNWRWWGPQSREWCVGAGTTKALVGQIHAPSPNWSNARRRRRRGEEGPQFVSPGANSRSKFLSRGANSRNIVTSPVIDEDEPLHDELTSRHNEEDCVQPESSTSEQQPDDSDEEPITAAAVYNPPALLNQELSMGESYTGDYSLTSFDEQVKIARKREMERRRSEASLKLGAAAPTMSLKERMKMFGK